MKNGAATIAVWGHFHGGNLGDDFVVEMVVRAIRERQPGARIVAVSLNPADSRERHGVDSFPLNRPRRRNGPRLVRAVARLTAPFSGAVFAFRCLRFLRGVDLLVVAGSGQLLDEFAGWRVHPAAMFRWSLLARLARTPVALASVGAGPIDGAVSRRLIVSSVRRAGYVTVRDVHSRAVLEEAGVGRTLDVVPDMAFAGAGLVAESGETFPRPQDALVVGLNVMAHQDPRYWPRGNGERYARYLSKMADVAARLAGQGRVVRVFSSQTRADARVAADLQALLAERGIDDGRIEYVSGAITTTSELLAFMRSCDVIVAGRYHSILLPLLLGIPVVAQAYHSKTADLMELMGQSHRLVGMDDFESEDLVARIEAALTGWSVAEADVVGRCRTAQADAVERQFDALFGLCAPGVVEPSRLAMPASFSA